MLTYLLNYFTYACSLFLRFRTFATESTPQILTNLTLISLNFFPIQNMKLDLEDGKNMSIKLHHFYLVYLLLARLPAISYHVFISYHGIFGISTTFLFVRGSDGRFYGVFREQFSSALTKKYLPI